MNGNSFGVYIDCVDGLEGGGHETTGDVRT